MGNMKALPHKRAGESSGAVLGAIEELLRSGRPVTVPSIVELTGMTRARVSDTVGKLRRSIRLPCLIERPKKADGIYMKVVAAAEQLELEGGTLTWDRIARRAGCTPSEAIAHAANAKRVKLWRWVVTSKYSLMTDEERSELARRKCAGRRNIYYPPDETSEIDKDELARVQSEWTSKMIDGRAEEDETPAGVAAVSHKDHERWNQLSKRFCEVSRADWDRPVHRFTDDRRKMF